MSQVTPFPPTSWSRLIYHDTSTHRPASLLPGCHYFLGTLSPLLWVTRIPCSILTYSHAIRSFLFAICLSQRFSRFFSSIPYTLPGSRPRFFPLLWCHILLSSRPLVSGATNIVETLVFKSIGFGTSGLQPCFCSPSVPFVYKISSPSLFVLSSVISINLSFSLLHQQRFLLSFFLSGFLFYFALCAPASTQYPTLISFQ